MSTVRQPPSPQSSPNPGDLAPRLAALGVLQAALQRRNGFDEAIAGHAMSDLTVRDRAFARALAMATLRNLGPIDRMVHAKAQKTPPEPIFNLLRLGAAQIFHLDTPAFAAVTTTVEMADIQAATRPYKGLINAVLRALSREPEPPREAQDYAPSWLYARWRAAYGEDDAKVIAASIALEPGTDLSLRRPEDAAALAEELEARVLPGGGLRTERRGELSAWPGFHEGRWWVQDAAAAIPARLLGAAPGQSILDLCAAPGGKTLQLAAAGADVIALDRSGARLQRLKDNLERTGLSAELVVADAGQWNDQRRFDGVLLDAPCSATGTFRRHPDVLWAARPGDVPKLAVVQSQLLDAAAGRVNLGGRLVYCVCSLEPEEGEAQSQAFLQRRHDFEIEPAEPGEGGAPERARLASGALRLTPGFQEPEGGLDGFFIVRFQRRR